MRPLQTINQLALVVDNLDEAVRRYWEQLRIGPWQIYTYQSPLVKEMTYRGSPHPYRMRLAIAHVGPLMLELIQPLSEANIYTEHLRANGPGLHHVGVFVPSLDEAVAEAARAGYRVLQSGRGYGLRGDGGYAYLDTQDLLGMIVELIELPAERVAPEAVYPPARDGGETA